VDAAQAFGGLVGKAQQLEQPTMPKQEGNHYRGRNTRFTAKHDKLHETKIAVRIPPFWPEEAITQLKGQFTLYGITDDEAKYAHVPSKIESKQARKIKDVITRPPAMEKYKTLKRVLIQRLTDSQERIRQLLEHEELGDRKLSQFLRHLTTLTGSTIPTELIRTLWLGRLQVQMQAILATKMEDRLEEVAGGSNT